MSNSEKALIESGFIVVADNFHDQYRTVSYRKGLLLFDCTYQGEELVSCELSTKELDCIHLSTNEVAALDKMFNEKVPIMV